MTINQLKLISSEWVQQSLFFVAFVILTCLTKTKYSGQTELLFANEEKNIRRHWTLVKPVFFLFFSSFFVILIDHSRKKLICISDSNKKYLKSTINKFQKGIRMS